MGIVKAFTGAVVALLICLQASAEAAAFRVPVLRDPQHNWQTNPVHNLNINPDYNMTINPQYSATLNPDYNTATNPRYNTAIDPNYTMQLNPQWNTALNPRFNAQIDPKSNWNINPVYNPSPNIPVTFRFSRQATVIDYIVRVNLQVAIAFGASGEPHELLITDAAGGYNVFGFERLEWRGYLKTNGGLGFNVFTLSGGWIGFTE